MEIKTIGELLHWSYANLAMAHSVISAKTEKYGRIQFMIRSRLYAGLNKKTMRIGPLVDDERLKMVLPQACCYCGSREFLSVDHLIPTKRGGANTGEGEIVGRIGAVPFLPLSLAPPNPPGFTSTSSSRLRCVI